MAIKKIEYTITSCLECRYIQSQFSGLCGHPKTPSKKIPALLYIPLWCPLEDA
jgi:hypothetical protein